MTITSSGAILQRTIVSEGVMFIFRQVVIGSAFPSDPKQQVLYIVGSVMKYWNGSAWIALGGGGSTVHNDLTGRDAASAHPASSISGLATVATSGSYNDLSDTPTIPINSDFALNGLSDVDDTGLTTNYILVWDGSKWVTEAKPTGGLDKTFQTLTEAATITFDASVSVNGSVTLTASRILGNITNAVAGEIHCVKVIQGGSGSYALTYGNQYKFSGGVLPILSATVGAVDLLFFLAVSTTEFHFINANFDVKTP